jgi:peptide/nickel transport system substrate-binding protein
MRTYTFYLEAAAFSDGSALTAQDVVSTYKAAQKSGYYAGRLNHMKSISVGADGAVVITLDTPMENLPLLLDIPIVKDGQTQAAFPLGTGPYTLQSTPEGMFLRRQAGWWCSAPLRVTAASMQLLEASSQLELRDLFEREELALVFSDPGSDEYVDFRGDYEPWESENGLFLYIGVNKKSKIFAKEAIRTALTHAIDRDMLVKKYFRGYAYSATLPASPSSPWYDDKLAGRYGYNGEAFKTAVTEAGLEKNEIVLLVNKDDSRRLRTAWAIRDMLTEGGLKVTMSEQNSKDFLKALKDGEYDLYLGQTKLSANMDLSEFFKENGALSYGGLKDVTLHFMSLEAMANSGNYYNLHKQIMEEGWLCPILFRSYAIYCKRGAFNGLNPARDNLFCYSLGKTMSGALLEN